MKKTALTLALLAAAFGAQAASQPAHVAVAATAASAVAAAVAAPAAGPAAPVAAAAAAAASAAVEQATVNVTGATTEAGAPMLLSVNGAKPVEPSFQQLFSAGETHPKWKVTQVKTQGAKSRMFLKSVNGTATLEMDASTTLLSGLQVKKDTIIDVETQTSGKGALIKFMKDKTPLGFMVNQTTKVDSHKAG